jgi:hypothetical protein
MTYDWEQDAKASYDLAIAEKRKAGVLSGEFKPRNKAECLELAKHFVTLQDKEGLSSSTIALRFHITRNAVCGMVHRARIKLGMRRPPPSHFRPSPSRRETPSLASLDGSIAAPRPRKPRKPKAIPEPPKALGGAFHILDLNDRQCRFATSSSGDHHLFCGAPVQGFSSWCAAHALRVFQPLAKRPPP